MYIIYKWIQWNKSSVGDGRHLFTVVVLANLRIDDFEVPPVRQKIEIERAWSLAICRAKWRTVATVGHRLAHLKYRMQLQVQMFYSSAFWMEVCCGRDQCWVNLIDVIRTLGESQVASTTHDGRARALGSGRKASGGGAPSPCRAMLWGRSRSMHVHAIHPVELTLSAGIRDFRKVLWKQFVDVLYVWPLGLRWFKQDTVHVYHDVLHIFGAMLHLLLRQWVWQDEDVEDDEDLEDEEIEEAAEAEDVAAEAEEVAEEKPEAGSDGHNSNSPQILVESSGGYGHLFDLEARLIDWHESQILWEKPWKQVCNLVSVIILWTYCCEILMKFHESPFNFQWSGN